MGVSYTNDIHPFWSSEGCTACHNYMNVLDLTASAATVCPIIRDGATVNGPGQYLDNPGCTASGSEIIDVADTGILPNGNVHTGGSAFPCFDPGGNCTNTILLWCTQSNPPICP